MLLAYMLEQWQSKQAKDIICGAYAQYMCGGTGKIWVCHLASFITSELILCFPTQTLVVSIHSGSYLILLP